MLVENLYIHALLLASKLSRTKQSKNTSKTLTLRQKWNIQIIKFYLIIHHQTPAYFANQIHEPQMIENQITG